jgi:hypothetical protein
MSVRQETTYLTAEEWAAQLEDGAKAAEHVLRDVKKCTNGPGEAVLALIMAARALCYAAESLPSFEWYAARLAEVSVKVDLAARKERPKA